MAAQRYLNDSSETEKSSPDGPSRRTQTTLEIVLRAVNVTRQRSLEGEAFEDQLECPLPSQLPPNQSDLSYPTGKYPINQPELANPNGRYPLNSPKTVEPEVPSPVKKLSVAHASIVGLPNASQRRAFQLLTRMKELKDEVAELAQMYNELASAEPVEIRDKLLGATTDAEDAAWLTSELCNIGTGSVSNLVLEPKPPAQKPKGILHRLSVAAGHQKIKEMFGKPPPPQPLGRHVSVAVMDNVRLSGLDGWEYDDRGLTEDDMINCLIFMFHDRGLLKRFQLDPDRLYRLIKSIQKRYKPNPYHNFRHAFDVCRTVYVFLTTGKAAQYLREVDELALLLGAIAHDVGHPGRNNNFLVATKDKLSIIYNDRSVLENYHAAVVFEILKDHGCNVLELLDPADYREVRAAMISAILATDMKQHVELSQKLEELVTLPNEDEHNDKLKELDPIKRQWLVDILLHAADISNPAKPWPLSSSWAKAVNEEFFLQGDDERRRGLPVTAHMDRAQTIEARLTLNFVDFAVQPMYYFLAELLPNIKPFYDTLQSNRQRLMDELAGRVHELRRDNTMNYLAQRPKVVMATHEENLRKFRGAARAARIAGVLGRLQNEKSERRVETAAMLSNPS